MIFFSANTRSIDLDGKQQNQNNQIYQFTSMSTFFLSFITFLDCVPGDIRWASQHLPELENLFMKIHPINFKNDFKREIRFKKVKRLKIRICDEHDHLKHFPFIFDQLEELDLKCYHLDEQFDFAYPNDLKKLKLYSHREPFVDLVADIINRWPKLEEISLQMEIIDDVTYLMDKLIYLKKIEMRDVSAFGGDEIFAGIQSNIGEEWEYNESKTHDVIIITKR